MEVIGHRPTKFGYKQAWKVINRNIWSLAGNLSHMTSFELWPTNVTFDPRISWRPIQGICKPSLVTNRHMVGKLSTVIVLQVNFHIWPHLTFDLLTWPLTPEYCGGQYRASTNYVWLQSSIYGWKVINHNSLAGKLSHLTLFDLWPNYMTFDPKILWRPTQGIYQPSLVTIKHMVGKLSTIIVLQVNFHIWWNLQAWKLKFKGP